MAKDIEIGIASETKAFKLGVEAGIIKPVEDAVQALDDMGKSRGPEQLEDGLKDAQRASERLEKETKQTADAIEREFRGSYRSVAQSADDGYDRAGEATRNFKEEAKQNFAEVASSFDGSAQGIADGIQGTLAGASIAVGGLAGAALGALAIVGGTVGNALAENIDEAAEKSEERIQSMYDSFLESGLNYLTQEQALAALSAITGDPERVAELQKQADELGLSIQTILAAQIEKGEARNEVQRRNNELLAEANQKLEDGTYTDGDRLTTLESIRDEYQKLNGEQETAIQGADLYRAASELITGEVIRSNEEIQRRNQILAQTPTEVPTKLVVDDSDLTAKVSKSQTVRLTLEGYTRTGQRVI